MLEDLFLDPFKCNNSLLCVLKDLAFRSCYLSLLLLVTLFMLNSTLSGICDAIPAFLCSVLSWFIFFYTLTFNMYLCFKGASWKYHIATLFKVDSLCLLTGVWQIVAFQGSPNNNSIPHVLLEPCHLPSRGEI